MTVFLLIVAFLVILAGCELFCNGVEWFGRKLHLGEGAVGSVLAAVGTALPETVIPIIAILFGSAEAGEEIGIGAILGAPFMLSTLAMFVCGISIVIFTLMKRRTHQDALQQGDHASRPAVLPRRLRDRRGLWASSTSGPSGTSSRCC